MSDGIKLYDENGEQLRVKVMGEDGEFLDYVTNPEQGVHGYEKPGQKATLVLESVN